MWVVMTRGPRFIAEINHRIAELRKTKKLYKIRVVLTNGIRLYR